MAVVEFQPVGLRVEVAEGTTVLDAARLAGSDLGRWGIRATCGGQAWCGQCRVEVLAGRVSGAGEKELEMLARLGARDGYRLACRARVLGDVRVGLQPVHSGLRLQVAGTFNPPAPEPAVAPAAFELSPPEVGDRLGDADRLLQALGRVGCDLEVLRGTTDFLRRQGYRGRAVTRRGEIIALRPEGAPLLGLAVDLGTTKLAAYLADLETGELLRAGARLNPQLAYGEDVVARLGYASASGENYARIRGAAVEAVNELAAGLCAEAGCGPEDVHDAVVGGNTAMHHLLLGLDVSQLGWAPYVPSVAGPVDVKARDLGLKLGTGTYVHLLPCVAGYVGGDHVAVLLATDLAAHGGVALAVDVGTNTEIALAKDGAVTCTSCASGPAFEGGHISRGMRAVAGAIDRVWLEGDQIRYSVVEGGEPAGFCGAAVIDLVAALLQAGLVDRSGRLVKGRPGVEEGSEGLQVSLGGVPLTQGDIRQLQLAKAAVRTGVEALLATTGTGPEEVDRVYVAGAFGVAIDPGNAAAIGMFPRLPGATYVPVGNAAGVGAYLALVSESKRLEAARLARAAGYVELTVHPGYQELFLSCLGFPGGA